MEYMEQETAKAIIQKRINQHKNNIDELTREIETSLHRKKSLLMYYREQEQAIIDELISLHYELFQSKPLPKLSPLED